MLINKAAGQQRRSGGTSYAVLHSRRYEQALSKEKLAIMKKGKSIGKGGIPVEVWTFFGTR